MVFCGEITLISSEVSYKPLKVIQVHPGNNFTTESENKLLGKTHLLFHLSVPLSRGCPQLKGPADRCGLLLRPNSCIRIVLPLADS